MNIAEIKERIAKSIAGEEKYARNNIKPSPGRNVYYDSLDAVEICRKELSGIPDYEDGLAYLREALKKLQAARESYRYSAVDEGGYGIATFHVVVKDMSDLYHSLGGREADLELPAETVGSELLYMANDPWERCFRAFALGDYIGCQVEAQSIIVKTAAIQHPKVRLLLLISLQRTDQAERAHDLATNVMLPKLNELFWLYALIQLTVGLADPEKVAAQALNDVELCQVNFYAGERFLTDNQESAAIEAFKACAAINVECDERYLALAELNTQNRAPIASLFQLSLRAEGFEKAGDVAQAAALLNKAYELAEQYLGETDFATQSLARRLVQLIDSGEA